MMHYFIPDLSCVATIATKFLNDWKHKKIFAFHGDLGAGKTTFISALLKEMGNKQLQGSPTYSLINAYKSEPYGEIYHIDCYRMNNEQEAFDIGLEELLYEKNAYFFIEWAEKIQRLLPTETITVNITTELTGERTIVVIE